MAEIYCSSSYASCNPKPEAFYVYAHYRLTNGSIFYIGKGKGRRAWDVKSKGRSPRWYYTARKNGYGVKILIDGLQEWYAFEMERHYIEKFGLENLCNLSLGGEGQSGFVVSDVTREKLSIAHNLPEAKEKNRNRAKEFWSCDEYRKNHKQAMADAVSRPSYRLKQSEAKKRMFEQSPERKKAATLHLDSYRNLDWVNERRKKALSTPEARKRNSMQKKAFAEANPGYFSKMANALWSCDHKREALIQKIKEQSRTPEARKKQSDIKTAAIGKAVIMDDFLCFRTIAKAVEWLKENNWPKAQKGNISRTCKGLFSEFYGHKWRYVEMA